MSYQYVTRYFPTECDRTTGLPGRNETAAPAGTGRRRQKKARAEAAAKVAGAGTEWGELLQV